MKILNLWVIVLVGALAAACDKVPLLAPTGSTVTLTANATTIPTGGTVGLTAFVTESSGTPVQNGTTIRFTTTLGSVSPVEAQTTNGLAVATFQAGGTSGVAEVHAVSGGATGTSSGSGATATTTNVIKITVGAAAVNTLTVTASPTSVSPNGGSAQVTATVFDANGGSLAGIPVTFSSDQGSVNPSVATTDSSGQATTTLTTSVDTTVTAASGTKTGTVKVTARSGPGITLACAVGNGGCSSLTTTDASNSVTVVFTVSKPTSSSSLRDVTLDFGDGTSQSLGNLPGGTATVPHTYEGSNGPTSRVYTPTVRATDVNGEITSTSTVVSIAPRGPLTVDLTAAPGTAVKGQGQPVTFTAKVTGGTAQSYAWDFDTDGNVDATTSSGTTSHIYSKDGRYTATVTVTATDNRTASTRTEFIISGTAP